MHASSSYGYWDTVNKISSQQSCNCRV